VLTDKLTQFDVMVNVSEGESSASGGRAPRPDACTDRVRSGAQAPFEQGGLVTRDAREVERKKVGLHKARRRKQYSKR